MGQEDHPEHLENTATRPLSLLSTATHPLVGSGPRLPVGLGRQWTSLSLHTQLARDDGLDTGSIVLGIDGAMTRATSGCLSAIFIESAQQAQCAACLLLPQDLPTASMRQDHPQTPTLEKGVRLSCQTVVWLRTFCANLSASNWKKRSGSRLINPRGTGDRGSGGRRSGLVGALRVLKLPGATTAFSKALRAALSSAITNFSARVALKSGPQGSLRFSASECPWPRVPSCPTHEPWLKRSTRYCASPLRTVQQHPGDQEKQFSATLLLGTRKNNVQPHSCQFTFPVLQPARTSSMANRNAPLTTPRMQPGTVFKTGALVSNIDLTSAPKL